MLRSMKWREPGGIFTRTKKRFRERTTHPERHAAPYLAITSRAHSQARGGRRGHLCQRDRRCTRSLAERLAECEPDGRSRARTAELYVTAHPARATREGK